MEKSKASSGKRKKKASGSAEGLPETPIPSIHVLLQVHLWTELGGDAPQSAREMVGDLLSASSCEVRDGTSSSSSTMASFVEPTLAVQAAWRLWRLVQGFSQASKTGHLGGCFILSSLEEAHPEREMPLAKLFPVLTRGHSGQVLLVGSLCESVRAIPGLRFETVSDEWMTPEAIRLYRTVLQLSPPVQMEGYVEEPIECWASAFESKPQAAVVEEIRVPPMVAEAPAFDQATVIELPLVIAQDTGSTPLSRNGADQEIAGFSRTEISAERKFPLRWTLVGCAAVAVVAVVAMIAPRSKRQDPSAKQSIPVAADPVPTVAPASPPPVALPPTPVREPKAVEMPLKPKAPDTPREIAAAKRKAAGAAHDQAAEPEITRPGGVTFTVDEISRMLAMADKDAGDGYYDKAIQEYDTALKHDPSNARAKEGRAKAIRNKGPE